MHRDRTILIAVLSSVGGVAFILVVIVFIQMAYLSRKKKESTKNIRP